MRGPHVVRNSELLQAQYLCTLGDEKRYEAQKHATACLRRPQLYPLNAALGCVISHCCSQVDQQLARLEPTL